MADHRGCAGTVDLRLRGKRVGRAIYVITSGRSLTVRVTLARKQRKLGVAFTPAIGKGPKASTVTIR